LQRAGSPRLGALEQENDNGGVEPATGCSASSHRAGNDVAIERSNLIAILRQPLPASNWNLRRPSGMRNITASWRACSLCTDMPPMQEGFTGARAEQARSTRPRWSTNGKGRDQIVRSTWGNRPVGLDLPCLSPLCSAATRWPSADCRFCC